MSPSHEQWALTVGRCNREGKENEPASYSLSWVGFKGKAVKLFAGCDKVQSFFSSKHYPLYSLNVASMWLKLGRLYMALENRTAGMKALKKVLPSYCVIRVI